MEGTYSATEDTHDRLRGGVRHGGSRCNERVVWLDVCLRICCTRRGRWGYERESGVSLGTKDVEAAGKQIRGAADCN